MLNGYKLGKQKLSKELFSDKYWKGGQKKYIYQFHTMDIEDGEDERQQLLINSDRVLFNMMNEVFRRDCLTDKSERFSQIERKFHRIEKVTRGLAVLQLSM